MKQSQLSTKLRKKKKIKVALQCISVQQRALLKNTLLFIIKDKNVTEMFSSQFH